MARPSIVHIYLYGLFKREIRGGNIIRINQMHPILKHTIRINKKYHPDIYNEMVSNGLMKRVGRDTFELSSCGKLKAPIDSKLESLW